MMYLKHSIVRQIFKQQQCGVTQYTISKTVSLYRFINITPRPISIHVCRCCIQYTIANTVYIFENAEQLCMLYKLYALMAVSCMWFTTFIATITTTSITTSRSLKISPSHSPQPSLPPKPLLPPPTTILPGITIIFATTTFATLTVTTTFPCHYFYHFLHYHQDHYCMLVLPNTTKYAFGMFFAYFQGLSLTRE